MVTTTQLSSRIDRVKVYAAGATVTRIAELTDRIDFVEITDLPLALQDESVRVRVEGSGTIPIAADFRMGLAVPLRRQDYPTPAETELRAASAQVRRLEDLIALINSEMQALASLRVPDRPIGEKGKAPPPSPMSARLALVNFTDEQLQVRLQERRAVEEQLRLAREHLADLEQKKAAATTAREARPHELRKTVVVRLNYEGASPVAARLLVEYFVPGARWMPTYVCRLDSRSSTATISVRALVCQRTGEDWSGVRLELSTAEPMAWCRLPELPSKRIGRAQPLPRQAGWRTPPVGAETLFEDYDRQRQSAVRTAAIPPVPELSLPSQPVLSPIVSQVWGQGNAEEDLLGALDLEPLLGAAPGGWRAATDAANAGELSRKAEEVDEFAALEALLPPPSPAMAAPPRSLGARLTKSALPAAQALAAASELSGRGLPVAPPAPEPEFPAVEPELPTYSLMRMGAADDLDRRSKLAIVRQEEFYLEVLQQRNLTVSFQVVQVIQQATEQAQSCLSLALPSGGVAVRQAAGAFDYAYSADGRVDIPADGVFHSIALTGRATQVNLRYIVVPREDTNAFRIAQLRNPLSAPLLSGPTEVYVDGEYVLTTPIATVPPLGQMELGLGVEQAIKVARNTFFQEVRSGKVLVAFNKFRHRIEIEIANRLPRPAQVEVRERVPVPQPNAKVEVQVDQVTPEWEKYEQQEREAPIQGGYRWQVLIPPGEKVSLSAYYTVKTYADNEIVGGNHREI